MLQKLKENQNILTGTIVLFVISRLFLIFFFSEYISDLGLFRIIADYTIKSGYMTYRDVWFPYPPLALPFLYLPSILSDNPEAFRRIFQFEMFAGDLACLYFLVKFMRMRLNLGNKAIVSAVIMYLILGVFMGHLLYDRYDILIATVSMMAAYYFTGTESERKYSYLIILLGGLIKLVPLFLIPVFVILGFFREKSGHAKYRAALNPILICVLPFIAVLLIGNLVTKSMLIKLIGEQGQRGIQIESVWGAPLLLYNAVKSVKKFTTNSEYAAQHINDRDVSRIYLFLSKYSGFAILCVAWFFLAAGMFLRQDFIDFFLKPLNLLLLFMATFLIIMSTQRVLSPQYVIWLIPGISIASFSMGKKGWFLLGIGAGIVFFTWIGFDIGYWRFVNMDLFFTIVVNLRNLLILILLIFIICHFTKEFLLTSQIGVQVTPQEEKHRDENRKQPNG